MSVRRLHGETRGIIHMFCGWGLQVSDFARIELKHQMMETQVLLAGSEVNYGIRGPLAAPRATRRGESDRVRVMPEARRAEGTVCRGPRLPLLCGTYMFSTRASVLKPSHGFPLNPARTAVPFGGQIDSSSKQFVSKT